MTFQDKCYRIIKTHFININQILSKKSKMEIIYYLMMISKVPQHNQIIYYNRKMISLLIQN